MAYGDISAIAGLFTFEATDVLYTRICHVHGEIYVIAYQIQSGDGWLATVNITAAGVVTATGKAAWEFEADQANWIDMIKIGPNVFAVVAELSGSLGRLYTVGVDNDGTITGEIEQKDFAAANAKMMTIVHMQGDVYAITYCNPAASLGTIVTRSITSGGDIGTDQLSTKAFDITNAYYTRSLRISDNVLAVVYNTTSYVITVKTFPISGGGTIGNELDTVAIDTADTWSTCHIVHAIGDVYIVSYKGPGGDGWAQSITITSAGVICANPIEGLEFDGQACDYVDAIGIGLGLVVIVYQGYTADGFICTIEVDDAGDITNTVKSSLEFEGVFCATPMIVQIAGDVYAIAYSGQFNDGYVDTVTISTPPAGEPPKHLMVMGIG